MHVQQQHGSRVPAAPASPHSCILPRRQGCCNLVASVVVSLDKEHKKENLVLLQHQKREIGLNNLPEGLPGLLPMAGPQTNCKHSSKPRTLQRGVQNIKR